MEWNDVGCFISEEFPELKTEIISNGKFQCRYYILPKGFKDVGKSLLFGEVQWGSFEETSKGFSVLEKIAKQNNLVKVVGPVNFSTYFNYRLKLDNFDSSRYCGEPVNNGEQLNQLLQLDFQIEKKYYSHEFKVKGNLSFFLKIILVGIWTRFRTKQQIKLMNLNAINYREYLYDIYNLTDAVFSDNFLYQKIPFPAFQIFFEMKIIPNIDSDASQIALNKNGDLLGYSLCLRDSTQKDRLLFKTIGVKKRIENGRYIGRQLMFEVYKAARKRYKSCLACLMVENNKPERMFRSNSFNTHSYALFSKDL